MMMTMMDDTRETEIEEESQIHRYCLLFSRLPSSQSIQRARGRKSKQSVLSDSPIPDIHPDSDSDSAVLTMICDDVVGLSFVDFWGKVQRQRSEENKFDRPLYPTPSLLHFAYLLWGTHSLGGFVCVPTGIHPVCFRKENAWKIVCHAGVLSTILPLLATFLPGQSSPLLSPFAVRRRRHIVRSRTVPLRFPLRFRCLTFCLSDVAFRRSQPGA